MAANIKGLVVEIGGDTTKLGQALESVNQRTRDLSSELGQINRLLRFDPGNADLLAQKQKVLADAIQETSSKLDTLREAERQVQQQFERGEVSEEQVRALQREIVATENKLKGYQNAAKETAQAVDDLGKESAEAAQEAAELNGAIASTGFKGLAAGVGAAVGALTAAAETTREYRQEMGKLDTAFTDNGFSVEAARGAYTELQSVLGETDQAVEAANHLAKLTDSEKDLAAWTGDILPGVFATFGASLPIEGLTEAANETAKVGAVTGPLADALNWAGVSEEAFNESLAKCTTEQERQALITQTLSGLYGEASAAYKQTNADVIAANAANEAWTASLAQVGAAVEPLLTEVKMMGAELLEGLVPVIQTLLDNLPVVGVTLGGITAAMAAFKLAAIASTAATQGMTLAQYAATAAQAALNAVMSANPIGLVILALTALAAGFTYLWNNSEAFRQFWIGLWESIKGAIDTAKNWIGQKVQEIGVFFTETLPAFFSGLLVWVRANWQSLLTFLINPFAGLFKYFYDNNKKFREFVNNAINEIKQLPGKVSTCLQETIKRVTTWASNMIGKAKTTASNFLDAVVSFFRQLPGKAASFLAQALQKVTTWASQLRSKGKAAAKSLYDSVVNGLKSLPSKVVQVGGDIVRGLWDGVKGRVSWLVGKLKGFADSVLGTVKKAFGIKSPSRVFRDEVGAMIAEGTAEGISASSDKVLGALSDVSEKAYKTAAADASSYSDLGKRYVDNLGKGLTANKETAVEKMRLLVDEQFAAFKDESGAMEAGYQDVAAQIMETYTEALDEGYDRAIDVVDSRISELTETYQRQYDALIAARDEMEQKLIDADSLFQFDEEGDVLLANLDKDIRAINQYERVLTELQERFGTSQTLLAEITELGISEGTAAAQKLLRMTDEEFQKFNEKWEEKQALAKAVAEKFYSDQIHALDVAFNQQLTATLESVPDTMKNIGVDSMRGWINGMNDMLPDLLDTVEGIASSMLDAIEDELGIASPSKETQYIGDMLDQGLAKGLAKNAHDPIEAMRRVSGQVLDAAATSLQGMTLPGASRAAAASSAANMSGLGDKLDAILSAIKSGQVLTIDGAALIGATAERYDAALGQRRALAARGAL